MTEEQLKRWVRRELPSDESLATAEWVVQCTAPELPQLLQAMVVEAELERLDARFASRGSVWARVVSAWAGAVDAGTAHVAATLGGGLQLASIDDVNPEPLRVLSHDGAAQVVFRPPTTISSVAGFLVAEEIEYLPFSQADNGEFTAFVPDATPRGAMIWVFASVHVPTDDPAADLDQHLVLASGAAWSVRLMLANDGG